MYDTETWNKLAWLESQDAVAVSYHKIHLRELNTRRRMEITAAARQAREYFAQAASADLSVKPLLTFYGVSSLSRACILLVGQHGGETSLAAAHGLQTVGWREKLDGDLSCALKAVGQLRVKTCPGLYMDLAHHTQNMICIHRNSSAVEWQLPYPEPELGDETDFNSLTARLPDLQDEVLSTGRAVKFVSVTSLTYNEQVGLKATIEEQIPNNVPFHYEKLGYSLVTNGRNHYLSAPSSLFKLHPIQLDTSKYLPVLSDL